MRYIYYLIIIIYLIYHISMICIIFDDIHSIYIWIICNPYLYYYVLLTSMWSCNIMLHLDFWSWIDTPLGDSADGGLHGQVPWNSPTSPPHGLCSRWTWPDRCVRSWRISFLEWPNSFRCGWSWWVAKLGWEWYRVVAGNATSPCVFWQPVMFL